MSIRKNLDRTEIIDANDKESNSEETSSIAPTQSKNTEDKAGSDGI